MKPVPIYCNTPIIRKLVSWGEKAFQKPKKKINNWYKYWLCRLSLVSCDGKESFEDVVAKYMNANFVCIKVDREERPTWIKCT
jgi:uncharacterized protein YyaL (SSP411 family)